MLETEKNNLSADEGTSPTEKSKKKTDNKTYRITKSESYKEHRCLLNGIEEKRVAEFNKSGIDVSLKEIKIIGCKVNDNGEIISIPYRWLEVK